MLGIKINTRKMLFVSVMALSLGLLQGCESSSAVTLDFADGEQKSLDEFNEPWLVVNYWAEWCGPCVHEIPELNALDGEPDVAVMAFDFDESSGAELAEKAERLKINIPMLLTPPHQWLAVERPAALPTTLLLHEGELKEVMVGPQTRETLQARIAALSVD